MYGVFYEEYGTPDVLKFGELPEPKIGPDSVLVKLKAAAVNPVDWKIMAGYLDSLFYSYFPIIPGWDLAGIVETVGPAVTDFRPGDKVFGYARLDFLKTGTFAEKISVPSRILSQMPSGISFDQAASVPLAGLTAYQALVHSINVQKNETVFIGGGAGGVGSFAIQIARALGANVIASASKRNHTFIEKMGATPVRYGPELKNDLEALGSLNVDAFFDVYGGEDYLAGLSLLHDFSRVASIAELKAKEVGGNYVFVHPSSQDLDALATLITSGELTPIIAETFSLRDVSKAFELSKTRHAQGKIVIHID